VQEAEAAEVHLVLHVARHHRLRHAKAMKEAGCRLLIVATIGRPADPEEHQEGATIDMAERFTATARS